MVESDGRDEPRQRRRIDRRRFLELGTLTAGGVVLASCGSASSTAAPAGATAAQATTPAGQPTAAAGAVATTAPAPTTAPAAAVVKTGSTVNQPVQVVFNTWWVPLQDAFTVLIKDFQDQNPGVTVKTQMITASYRDKMSAALVAGNWGDAATSDNGIQSKWMSAGYHYDMTAWAQQDKLNLPKNYGLGGLEIWCGKVLNLPMDNDDRAIYYNKTMIKAAGAKDPWDDLKGKWTWDDLFEIAQKCTKKDSSGKISQFGFEVDYGNTQEWENFIWSLGGNYANWETGKFNYLDPAVIKAQELLHKWATKDRILMTKADISGMQGSSGINPFRAGIVAMYQRASYDATLNEKEIGTKFEWDAAPIPDPGTFNPGHQGVPQSTANPNFVPKSAKNAKWGYKLIAYLCGDKAENIYAQKKTMMVANKHAWKTYQDTAPPKHASSFVYYVYGRPHGFHYYSDITAEVFNSIVIPELDKAYLGQQNIKTALTNAQRRIDALGKSQSAPCPSPYGTNASPQPALSTQELTTLGVIPKGM